MHNTFPKNFRLYSGDITLIFSATFLCISCFAAFIIGLGHHVCTSLPKARMVKAYLLNAGQR